MSGVSRGVFLFVFLISQHLNRNLLLTSVEISKGGFYPSPLLITRRFSDFFFFFFFLRFIWFFLAWHIHFVSLGSMPNTIPPEHVHGELEDAHPEEEFARTGSEYSPCHVNIASSILLGLPHLKDRPRKRKRHRLHITYHCVRKEVRAEITLTSSIIPCVFVLHSWCRWCHLWSYVYYSFFF